jgi:hypothetical protein
MANQMQLSAEGNYLLSLIKKNVGKIEALEKSTAKQGRTLRDIEEEYPLLPPEADDLSNAVKRKGVYILGGKKSNAYQNTALRKRVYQDIYSEIKRQYGLIDEKGRQQSYKKLKRKYLKGAFSVVEDYEAPIALANEIEAENELDEV